MKNIPPTKRNRLKAAKTLSEATIQNDRSPESSLDKTETKEYFDMTLKNRNLSMMNTFEPKIKHL